MSRPPGPAASSGRPPGPAVPRAGLGRTLSVARPAAGRIALATLLGAGAIGAAIGLLGTSAWLISRASQRPSESALGIALHCHSPAVQEGALRRTQREPLLGR